MKKKRDKEDFCYYMDGDGTVVSHPKLFDELGFFWLQSFK